MKNSFLHFPKKKIVNPVNETLCWDYVYDQEVAAPLFDIGLHIANITERPNFANKATFKSDSNMFILLLQGSMKIVADNIEHQMSVGDLAYYSPHNTIFQDASGGAWWIYLKFFEVDIWKPMHKRGFYIKEYESTELLYLLLKRIIAAKKTRSIEDITHAKEDASTVVTLLKRELPSPSRPSDRRLSLLKELIAEIAAEPQAKWRTDVMAAQLNVSVRQLTRLFQKEYGMGPIELVIKYRLMKASELLTKTNRTIESIAYELNYVSFHTFSALFKKHIGLSPSEYRRSGVVTEEFIV